jgi:hypothetical protein
MISKSSWSGQLGNQTWFWRRSLTRPTGAAPAFETASEMAGGILRTVIQHFWLVPCEQASGVMNEPSGL